VGQPILAAAAFQAASLFVVGAGHARRSVRLGEAKGSEMLQPITTVHYLVLSASLLLIGTIGVLTRRNIVIILMSIELILNAVNINLIAFSQHLQNMGGQIFTIFVITDAVAEAAVGLGILIALFRNKETVLADQIDLLKW
jgi:NADH-quinone oxidoreductase subunit K